MSLGTWMIADHGSAWASVPSQPGKSTSGSIIPLKKIAKAPLRKRAPLASSIQKADDATMNRSPKLTTTASTRLTANAAASSGLDGSRMWKKISPMNVGPRPRVTRWYVARPRSPARYQPTSPVGRYRSIATSPVLIRSARSSVVPPPHSATVIRSA